MPCRALTRYHVEAFKPLPPAAVPPAAEPYRARPRGGHGVPMGGPGGVYFRFFLKRKKYLHIYIYILLYIYIYDDDGDDDDARDIQCPVGP